MERLTERFMHGLGVKDCYDSCSVCDVARCCGLLEDILEKLAHYEDLEEQLEKLYGGKMPLDEVVKNLNRIVQNGEEKLDYARILTNAEAEKWDKWKDLEEQGRLIELPCAVGDMVYVIAPRYVECDKKYNCEDYNSEEYLITWCQNYCPNGYKGKGISPTKIEAIHIIEDGIDLSTILGRYHIENVFTTREAAESKLAEMEGTE